MKKNYLVIIVVLFIAVVVVFFVMKHKKTPTTIAPYNGMILYYSDQCPHCKLVKQYIDQNEIHQKVTFIEKEVLNNQKNANELVNHALFCEIPSNNIQIPLLWTGSSCIVGDAAVINYLKQKANEQAAKTH